MKKLTFLLLLGTALAVSQSAQAEENCSSKTISWEVDACSVRNKEATEVILNKEYSAAKKRIEEEYKADSSIVKFQLQTLLETQRSWLAYREGQCKMEASLADENSNAHLGLMSECINKLDKQRIVQFKEMPYG